MSRMAGSPAIGWFTLSDADRAAAARYLSSLGSDGTRDELGFAPIHFAVADQFFPGTSVQHAQLRYVLFVAWTYQELMRETAGAPFPIERLADVEARFSERLIRHAPQLANSGISGWTRYQKGKRPVIRVSQIYWSALKTWGLLKGWGPSGQPPNQADLHRGWMRLSSFDEGGDGAHPLQAELFDPALPAPPSNWTAPSAALSFELRPQEKTYIKSRWRCAGNAAGPPLLSRLADAGVATDSMWSRAVSELATPAERRLLRLAREAAALSCIARAVHSVLIERRRNEDLDLSDDRHAAALPGIIQTHRTAALALDATALRAETGFDIALEDFLILIQTWLDRGGKAEDLLEPITVREHSLKGARAYLSNEERRREWDKGAAQPLDYRWPAVRHLISSVI
jgi:hypothetical protein